jgi:uncharacterized membrane protein YhiD involved in acid resistance
MGSNTFFLIIILTTLVALMGLRIIDDSKRYIGSKKSDQQSLRSVAQLATSARHQKHPVSAHRDIILAKFKIESLVEQYGSIPATERALKMQKGDLQELYDRVEAQLKHIEQSIHTLSVYFDKSLADNTLDRHSGWI